MFPSQRLSALLVAAGLVLAAGCSHDTPTEIDSSVVPRIMAAEPASVYIGSSPQLMTISGERFLPGASLVVTTPTGDVVRIAGVSFTATASFQAYVVFDRPGGYALQVENLNGDRSDPRVVFAKIAGDDPPLITRISPVTTNRSAQPLLVTLQGLYFSADDSVVVVPPSGTPQQFSGADLNISGSTSIQLNVTVNEVGAYTFIVTTHSQGSSNIVILAVL